MSNKHVVWASEALEQDKLAPSAEKAALGWVEERPPHEWFNWHMNRTDTRLDQLETPTRYSKFTIFAYERNEPILAGQRFDLPRSYIVGTGELKIYMDGLLCEPGMHNQYVECGEMFSESTYIRFNDDIPIDYDITVEVPIKALEPVVYADEALVGTVNALKEKVKKLEEPVFSIMVDSPADTRDKVIRAGEIYNLGEDYIVGSNQLTIFKNGILLYKNVDYREVGKTGDLATDIVFSFDIAISDAIRAMITIRDGEKYTVLSGGESLKVIAEKVALFTKESRIDIVTDKRVEAMSEFAVPQYRVGTNTLRVYKDGLLLMLNRDYSENNEPGQLSEKIVFSGSVDAGTRLTFIAPERVQ